MFHLYCIVTTFQLLFIIAVWTVLNDEHTFTSSDLFKVQLVALASVLPVLIHVRKKIVSRTQLIIRQVLHFILTAGVVFGLLIYFEWIDEKSAAATIVFFLAIYIPAYLIQEIRARKLAKQLNEKINAFHNSENATHDETH